MYSVRKEESLSCMLVVGIISEKVPLLLNREFGDRVLAGR
jgi:hypothetical protein